ncbi:MAG: hypothetical protein ACOX2G_03445 [Bacillota bacterium]|jgi:hypothetical protein
MKARYYFLLGGVLVLAAVVLIFLLQPWGLGPYQDLLEQQEFTRARTALTKELAKKPHWHAARALLAEVEIAAGQPLAALEQILLLWEGDWDTKALEEKFLEHLPFGEAEPALALLAEQPQSFNTARLALGIALKHGSSEQIANLLLPLSKLQPGHPLIAQAWTHLKESDPVAAWQIADELNASFKGKLLAELKAHSKLEDFLLKLLAADPQAPSQLINLAKEWGGMEGLELLLAMEETGWTPQGDASYPHVKFNLLLTVELDRIEETMLNHISWDVVKTRLSFLVQEEADPRACLHLLMVMEDKGFIPGDEALYAKLKLDLLKLAAPRRATPSFFAGIDKSELLALAIEWIEYSAWDGEEFPPETTATLLDYLGQDGKFRDQVAFLKIISQPPPEPAPERIFINEQRRDQGQLEFWEVSPCGRHVLYCGWGIPTTYWFDLDKNEHVAELSQSHYGVWDPSGGKVALIPREGDTLYVYDTDSAAKIAEFPWSQATILGWQDGNLLLANSHGNGYQVEALDPTAGERTPMLTAPVLPSLSQQGKLGYLIQTGSSVQIVLDGEEMIFSGSWSNRAWRLHGWLPRDKGIVLAQEGEYAILSFADGAFLPLPIEKFTPHPQGWLDEHRLAGTCSVAGNAVLILDIRDMSWTHTGIRWYFYGELTGNTACRFQDGNLLIFTLR